MQEITHKFIGSFEPQRINPISNAELDAAEQKIGYPLPADYREFLLHYGEFFVATGIESLNSEFGEPFFNYDIDSFYGVNAHHPELDLVKRHYQLLDLTPPGLLRLGTGDNGFVALSLTGEHQGSIYFVEWSNSSSEPDDIRMVANSFDEFIQLLEPRSSEQ